ncbi:helical backbone metal receptor [Blastococcus sp. Marseille-P5729]|uniref:helical backbone metal receptor n=1 Tax=Blastococcus sp. Marseille-P5729 TaxID=2086582 RepID=UPI000D10A4AF|nr:helical backbone metal receptor [Blastococcus sp. Marseille-P5729]
MPIVTDDLGREVRLGEIRRVVSLVPSLTESIAYDAPELLVGVTDWCTHPHGLTASRIGGTKKPDIGRIVALRPDVVVANKEENKREDVDALVAAGVPVYVTDPNTLDEALRSIGAMLDALALRRPAWLDTAARVWASPVPQLDGVRTVCFIWRKPWMAVGSHTFSGDLIERLGLVNVVTEPRYPRTDPAVDAELILLPDEPYPFSLRDGPEAFPGRRCALFEGRYLTWYGPSLVEARAVIAGAARGPVIAT